MCGWRRSPAVRSPDIDGRADDHRPPGVSPAADLFDRDLPWPASANSCAGTGPQSLRQRLIEPAEIANLVVHPASDQAPATTGGALRVDGGYVDAILPCGVVVGRGHNSVS